MTEMKKIAIIGGGAAGLMAAATILERDDTSRIILFDKNKQLGAKVIISGGGRCNVTTGVTKMHELLKNYTRGAEFLKAAQSKFGPQAVYNWFEDHGVPLKMQDDLRAFPESDDGHDIVGVFTNLFAKFSDRIKVITAAVQHITAAPDGGFFVHVGSKQIPFNRVIIATGGSAYRHTGSTGDGYAFAQELGHSITQLGPSLNSFMTHEKWCANVSGIALPHARLRCTEHNVSVAGPLLFTHFGISGPVVFSLSSHIPYHDMSEATPLRIEVLIDATMNFEKWNQRLLEACQQQSKKQLKSLLSQWLPQRLATQIFELAGVAPEQKAAECSKDQRKALAHMLSGSMKLNLVKRRPGDEFVTAGGVSTDEINPQTMESKIAPGLFFAGEVMNVDGVTGGFNLQSSWATGRLAGLNAAK
jgi:predicted Rossmann fold flavoprotein